MSHPTPSAHRNERAAREAKLRQRGHAIWLFGISAAGKTTLATGLEQRLEAEGFTTQLLDGDELRAGLNRDLGFTSADRTENLRRAAEVARLFVQAGIVTICSFITPARSQREMVRRIVGPDDVTLFHVLASYSECARRDPKGLYARAAAGGVEDFTGRDSVFERPTAAEPAIELPTEGFPPAESLELLHGKVIGRVSPNPSPRVRG